MFEQMKFERSRYVLDQHVSLPKALHYGDNILNKTKENNSIFSTDVQLKIKGSKWGIKTKVAGHSRPTHAVCTAPLRSGVTNARCLLVSFI
jgi:hypothetical protein